MMTMTDRQSKQNETGMTLFAVMAIMAVFAVALLAVAPSVQQNIQRERETEAIFRGEEVAEAIRQYVIFYRGAKLPNSMDDLLKGLPQGSHQRMILRPEAAVDPLSEDGKWRLVKADVATIGPFARRVQNFNGGALPANPNPVFDRWSGMVTNSLNLDLDSDNEADDFDVVTDNQPFIGVASQDKGSSIIAYYGIENHSKWVFTPLFRGTGTVGPPRPVQVSGQQQPF
jgi:type II secretory pathway pseudopilin PulG